MRHIGVTLVSAAIGGLAGGAASYWAGGDRSVRETARGEPRGSLAVREVRIVDEAGAVRAVLGVDDAGRVALDLMDPDGTGRTSLWLAGEDQGRQCGLTLTGSGGRWPGVIQVRGGDWSLYAQARPGGPTIPVFLRPGGRIAGAKNGPGL
jgi:hypothetical protein